MNQEDIDYRTLRKIQQLEKNSPTLSKIDPNFYVEMAKYLKDLDKRIEKKTSAVKDQLLMDEIQNIKKIAISVYEYREKKILLSAITKARGGNPDLKNLVDEEKKLYESIYELMKHYRYRLLLKKPDNISEKDIDKIDNKKEEKPVNTNPIVMVKENIPEFIGTDKKKYNLRKNDVLSLPEDMQKTLYKRGVVRKLK
jgi:DNA replication initiation complex subunit (GINS family)